MQPLKNCIGPTIRIGQEIRCLPYAGFFLLFIKLSWKYSFPILLPASLDDVCETPLRVNVFVPFLLDRIIYFPDIQTLFYDLLSYFVFIKSN